MKRIFFVIGLLTISIILEGQNFYTSLGGSYNIARKNQLYNDSYSAHYSIAFENVEERHTKIRSSLGQGYMGNLTIGYQTTKQISFDLTMSYLYGKPISTKNEMIYSNGVESASSKEYSRSLLITPSLILYKDFKILSPYLSLGFALGFLNTKREFDYRSYDDKIKVHIDDDFTGRQSYGYTVKLGVQKKFNEILGVYGDVSITNLTFSPDKREMTSFTVNGIDSINTLKKSVLQTEYSDDYTKKYKYENGKWVESWDESVPRKSGKFDIPFSYISINLGIRIYFIKPQK